MAKFTDKAGREWAFDLSVGEVERLKDEAGFDVDALAADPEAVSRALFQGPRVVAQILWVLCQDEAKARGVDARAFGFLLDRGALDRGTSAFLEAFLLFYPRSSAGRAIAARLPEIEARMDAAIEKEVNAQLDRELSRTATASPGSSASTPAG